MRKLGRASSKEPQDGAHALALLEKRSATEFCAETEFFLKKIGIEFNRFRFSGAMLAHLGGQMQVGLFARRDDLETLGHLRLDLNQLLAFSECFEKQGALNMQPLVRFAQVIFEKGMPHTTCELLVVALRDPGKGLQDCLRELRLAETNIDFAYALIPHPQGKTLMAFHVEDYEFGRGVLHNAGLEIVTQDDLSR